MLFSLLQNIMHSLFKSFECKYLCMCQGDKGAIGFIAPAQPHQGPFHTLSTDSGAPVQLSPGLLGLASAMSQKRWSPALPQLCPVSPWNPLTWTSTPGLSSWPDPSHHCHYRPAWSLQDLIPALTYELAFQLDPRPASSLWCTPMIQTLLWLWPSSLSLPCSPHWLLWDSVCWPWDFPLDAWLSFSDRVSAVLMLSIDHIKMKEFCVSFREALRNKGFPYTLVGTPPRNPE